MPPISGDGDEIYCSGDYDDDDDDEEEEYISFCECKSLILTLQKKEGRVPHCCLIND
jgi:hypothetical protein